MRNPAPLPPPFDGERLSCTRRAGRLSYTAKGRGAPVLLLHSINAAACAYEVRPIWEAASPNRRYYAPDLPGFGHSDRSDRRYDQTLYVDAIADMLDEIEAAHGPVPVDVVALSLTCEFLARAVVRAPHRFRRLAFVTPTGFQKGAGRLTGPAGATREVPGVNAVVSLPLLGDALWGALVSRPSIRFFLQKTFGSKDIDEGLFTYCYLTAHQPGAKYAPLAFVTGRLFSADVRSLYGQLTLPIWVARATRGDFADFSEAGWLADRTNWTVEPFPTGALVHFQDPARFMAGLETFLDRAPAETDAGPSGWPDAARPSV